jgi:hypothetical protein
MAEAFHSGSKMPASFQVDRKWRRTPAEGAASHPHVSTHLKQQALTIALQERPTPILPDVRTTTALSRFCVLGHEAQSGRYSSIYIRLSLFTSRIVHPDHTAAQISRLLHWLSEAGAKTVITDGEWFTMGGRY